MERIDRHKNYTFDQLAEEISAFRTRALIDFHEEYNNSKIEAQDIRIIKVPRAIKAWRKIGRRIAYQEELINYIETFDLLSQMATYAYHYNIDPDLIDFFETHEIEGLYSPES